MTAFLLRLVVFTSFWLASVAAYAQTYIIEDIEIEGLERITAGTALTYLPITVGDTFDDSLSADVVRGLFQSGLFSDVRLARRDNVLIILVQERPAINEIRFDGNREIPSEALTEALRTVGLQRGRVFNQTVLDRVEGELRQQYLARGRYNAEIAIEITELPRNRVDIDIRIAEGQAARIRGVNIVGNEAFSNRELTRGFESGIPRWWAFWSRRDQYAREKLAGDIEGLRSRYLDAGFLEFDVTSTQVTLTPDREDLFITINVEEGVRYSIGEITVAGQLVVPEEELLALIQIASGETFSRRQVINAAERISRRLGVEGYALTNVNPIPEVDADSRIVDLTFFIDPGPRVYVRRMLITGQERTQESVYRREFRQMEGTWYNVDLVDRSRTRVQRLPFVESVSVEMVRVEGREDEVDLVFTVVERLSGTISIGAGFSQDQGIIASAGLSQDNFLGSGNQVNISLSASAATQAFNFSVLNPHYTIHGATRGFSLFYRKVDASEIDISRYTSNRFGANVIYGFPLSEVNTLSLEPGFEKVEIITASGVSERILERLERDGDDYLLWRARLAFTHDSRNRVIMAEEGRRHRLSFDIALPGSDLEYFRSTYEGQELFRLSEDYTLSLSSGIGYGSAYGKTEDLPFFEHFFAGGIDTVRGFRASSLGPDDGVPNFDPFGGAFRTIASAELFFPAPFAADNRSLRMSGFVDAGQVFESIQKFSGDEIRVSAGLALNWISPVGALSFSYGIPLRDQSQDRRQEVQFKLGSGF